MTRHHLRRVTASAVAALSVLVALRPADAAAITITPAGTECALGRTLDLLTGKALIDADGFSVGVGATASSGGYATLWDGSDADLLALVDSWRGWGQLFVGATPSDASRYVSADAQGCQSTHAGQGIDFATVTLDGLKVRRSLLVPAAGSVGGVRIVDALTNDTNAPITTSVWVGDLRDGITDGLGSDATTRVRATSAGDGGSVTLDTADDWAVTSDARQNTFLDPSDPAIAHVWNGPGGEERASVVRSGGQAGDAPVDNPSGSLDPSQFGWGWQNVTVPAGKTVRYLSWELLAETDDLNWSTQAPLAKARAEALVASPLSAIYQGMSAAEIASVRNWQRPAVAGTVAAPNAPRAGEEVTLSAAGVDFGSTVDGCSGGTLSWNFGDGASATGTTVSHRFAEGAANVTLAIEGACGGRLVRTLNFSVGAALAVATPTPAPTATLAPSAVQPAPAPAAPLEPLGDGPQLRLYGPPSVKTTTLAGSHGLVVGVQGSVDGKLRLILTGKGVKSVKVAKLEGGKTAFVKVRLAKSARSSALKLKTIRLRAKLTPDGGGEPAIESLYLKLKR